MSDRREEKPIGLMLRLPPDLHAEVVRISKGNTKRPPTSLNGAVIFLLRAGIAALKKEEGEPGNSVLALPIPDEAEAVPA